MNNLINLEHCLFYGLKLDRDQEAFVNCMNDPAKILISCEANAGSGKTLISVAMANLLVSSGVYDKLIYIVFPCQEHYIGYLPGTLEEKSKRYFEPLLQALIEININPCKVLANNLDSLKQGSAYIYPMTHSYLRGVNFSKSIVILDESQNATVEELKKVLTRCHDNCKVIMIGNDLQCDLRNSTSVSTGFTKVRNFFKLGNYPWYYDIHLRTNHRGVLAQTADQLQ